MLKSLFAIGVGESVKVYEDKLHFIFERNKTITIHNGMIKLYEKHGLIPDYYTWGDPFGCLPSLRFLNNTKLYDKITIIVPSTMSTSFEEFRKHHGTSKISHYWDEYISLLNSLFEKGFNIVIAPVKTTKEKYPSLHERFNSEYIWLGTIPYIGDSSEDRNAVETKLTYLVFPLAHYLGFNKINVLGFDCIGGRFYDKIEGVPQDPWKQYQLPYLIENLKIWKDWQDLHRMEITSVVEDRYTINNQVLEYKSIEEICKK